MDLAEVKRLEEQESIRTILRRAADLIEQRGWCQHRLQDSQGRLCFNGGIMAAIGMTNFVNAKPLIGLPASEFAFERLGGEPAYWNNAPERTKEEVVAKLRELADQAG